jgi:predicted enzyme related to lactoylglutathione lyase
MKNAKTSNPGNPPRSGVIVYARDISTLSRFYLDVFDMLVLRETDEFVSIANQDLNLVIHKPPMDLPSMNFNTVKMFLTVSSLQETRKKAIELGGESLPGEWLNPIFRVCNIADSEGNHIQLREFF